MGLELAKKVHDLVLRPVAVVAVSITIGEEGTMAAIFGFEKGDIGIGTDLFSSLGKNANERIISGVQNERRNRNAIHYI